MKVWISCDMEGVAGIVDWTQCRPDTPTAYALGCKLTLDEVNAAIEGALDAGADEIIVNDSHGRMANLDPAALKGNARYLAGRHKPMYMMQGLDESVDAIFFIGYHGSISGRPSAMSHTYNPEVFQAGRVNGTYVGESGINALVAQHYGVPIALVSGDQITREETLPFAPDAEYVVTKESITRFSALSLHPEESRARIRAAAKAAIEKVAAGQILTPSIPTPARLELDVQTADMADVAAWVGGVTVENGRTVVIEGEDLLNVFQRFVAVNYITRQAGGR
ncbi:M55 family metallopeptidase [Gryllotalpicola kribbensis]|uniref:M55 family metallopeptidase n=1 Tax=Gryllotalpicola kribbensis TaxID=993084 RepID=A0ABP8AFF7_9MICO